LRIFSILLSLLIFSGCETTKLWDGNKKSEFVRVVPQSSSDDVEAFLKSSGREFYCVPAHSGGKLCYAEISAGENIKVKLLRTPETLLTDAGDTITVIGYVLFQVAGFR